MNSFQFGMNLFQVRMISFHMGMYSFLYRYSHTDFASCQYVWELKQILLQLPAHSNISLYSDGKSHVDGGTEGHSGHGVEDGHVHLGEEDGVVEPGVHEGHGGIGMNWHIKYYVSEIEKW